MKYSGSEHFVVLAFYSFKSIIMKTIKFLFMVVIAISLFALKRLLKIVKQSKSKGGTEIIVGLDFNLSYSW